MNRMKDDLISRKALMEEIQSFRCSITGLRAGKGVLAHAADEYRKSILQIIDNQPIAFDKESVIEEIKEKYGQSAHWETIKGICEIIEKGGLN